DIVRSCILGSKHQTRHAFAADGTAKAAVRADKIVATGDSLLDEEPVADRQRLQERAIRQVDAGVDGAEGMISLGRDCETELRKPLASHIEVCGRKNQMIKRSHGSIIFTTLERGQCPADDLAGRFGESTIKRGDVGGISASI